MKLTLMHISYLRYLFFLHYFLKALQEEVIIKYVKNIRKVYFLKINWWNCRPRFHFFPILLFVLYFSVCFLEIKDSINQQCFVLCNIIFNVFSHPCIRTKKNIINMKHFIIYPIKIINHIFVCKKKRVRPWDY